ncbi:MULTISPECIES: PIN-like domain-containing protein [Saccharothrix]|uniref:PIN-like domain-containing protein n=1 Tax=Saccharothrix TaxID=2071 RepID=UPI001160EEA9|nr:PIN-like domain-containing protein [Saccharothrix sp. CB00851]
MAHRNESAEHSGDRSLHFDPFTLRVDLDFGVFIPDANILLDLYRLPPHHRAELSDALWTVVDRLWVPHQAMSEVLNVRPGVMETFRREIGNRSRAVAADYDKLEFLVRRDMREWRIDKPDADHVILSLRAAKLHYQQIADSRGNEVPAQAEQKMIADVTKEIDRLTTERVGAPPEEQERARWIKDSQRRVVDRRPPTAADRGKREPIRHNDCLIWHQMLKFAREHGRGRPIVLITRDLKEDGWVEYRDRRPSGAHPLLVEEMHAAAGSRFVVITAQHLLSYVHEQRTTLWRGDRGWGPDADQGTLRPIRSLLPWNE